ncbi:integrase [Massilia sp. MP_M2]|uniref:tyrosine-type recombinase/integrase n=1 Tax=Massilia sp. MP_M2 TaxID=3071713 RepID=UPI00319EB5F1
MGETMAKVKFTAGRVADFPMFEGERLSFLWDAEAPGLGLRATPSGGKSYIFQAKIRGQVVRLKIGDPEAWAIPAARAEARRLKVIIDNGQDPRQVKADGIAADQAERMAKAAAVAATAAAAVRNSMTLGDVWPLYIADRAPQWGERHAADHLRMIKPGGEPRLRSNKKVTEPAPLASLAGVRLVDLTAHRIEAWARTEAVTRPTSARLAWRMLKACLNWCTEHPVYGDIIEANPAQSKKVRESLGKPTAKNDVLQREQLPAWFAAVRQIGNPVTSAYLQCLLLSGARREELGRLKWTDVDFLWKSITIRDKVDGLRVIPLPPYMEYMIAALPRRNEWVFSSMTAADGRLADPTPPHKKACAIAALNLSLHGLRRSFASLCEWTETPAGIAAQIQGHKPQGVREQNYIRRPLDLLRMWHVKIEGWMLEQAGIEFAPISGGLKVVATAGER